MSEEKPKLIDRVENVARYLKAAACMARSIKTLAIAGVVIAATAIVVPLGYKAYNKVNDIADMPGEMISSAKGGLKSAWDHTGGAAISGVANFFDRDDEEPEVIVQTEALEVEATITEEITADSVEVTYEGELETEPEAEEGKGFFRMPRLCVPFVNCNKDVADDAEVDEQLEIEQDPELMENPELLPAPQ